MNLISVLPATSLDGRLQALFSSTTGYKGGNLCLSALAYARQYRRDYLVTFFAIRATTTYWEKYARYRFAGENPECPIFEIGYPTST